HSFLRDPKGQLTVFDPVGPASDSEATAINNRGDIVGDYSHEDGLPHGYVRHADGTFTLVDFPGASDTIPSDINDRGVIVGEFSDSPTGFVLSGGSFSTVEDAPGSVPMVTDPPGMNNSATSVGCFLEAESGNVVGYILRNGRYTNVSGDVPGFACLFGVNDVGLAVGFDFDGNFVLDTLRPQELIRFTCPSCVGLTLINKINNR